MDASVGAEAELFHDKQSFQREKFSEQKHSLPQRINLQVT